MRPQYIPIGRRKPTRLFRWVDPLVHESKSTQHVISSLLGTGTAKFQVTWLCLLYKRVYGWGSVCGRPLTHISGAYRWKTLLLLLRFFFLFSSRKLAEKVHKGKIGIDTDLLLAFSWVRVLMGKLYVSAKRKPVFARCRVGTLLEMLDIVTVHSEIFSQILFDLKKSISGPIELKFSGKTLYAIL